MIGRVAGKSALVLRLSEQFKPRCVIYEGAVRSGKTVTSILDFLKFCMSPIVGDFAIVGRTQLTAVRNVVEVICAFLGPDLARYNNDGVFFLFDRAIRVYGADNKDSVKKIQGGTFAGLYLDELATLPEEFFNMARTRMSVPGARMWATCNPEHSEHWVLKRWLERATLWVDADGAVHTDLGFETLGVHRYTFILDDNPHLAPEFVQELKDSFTGVWYERYILSRWSTAAGAIFDGFDRREHVVPWAELPRMDRFVAIGMDYGTAHPSAALLVGMADGKLWVCDEWRYEPDPVGLKWTDAQQSASYRQWREQPHTPHSGEPKLPWTIVDSAATSFITQLRADRVPNVMLAVKDVLPGIRLLASLLHSRKLVIADRCQGLIKELPQYVWDPKKAEAGEDAPLKTNDHSIDALRYAVFNTRTVWASHVDVTIHGEGETSAAA